DWRVPDSRCQKSQAFARPRQRRSSGRRRSALDQLRLTRLGILEILPSNAGPALVLSSSVGDLGGISETRWAPRWLLREWIGLGRRELMGARCGLKSRLQRRWTPASSGREGV